MEFWKLRLIILNFWHNERLKIWNARFWQFDTLEFEILKSGILNFFKVETLLFERFFKFQIDSQVCFLKTPKKRNPLQLLKNKLSYSWETKLFFSKFVFFSWNVNILLNQYCFNNNFFIFFNFHDLHLRN